MQKDDSIEDLTISEQQIKAYVDIRPLYKDFTSRLKQLLEDLTEKNGINAIVDGRTKSVDSFKEKVNRIDKSYKDPLFEITDLSGLRIIVNSLEDVNNVEKLIESEFNVDNARSTNKSEELDINEFGYLSRHFIVQINDKRGELGEWDKTKGLFAEIQVRTVLQHAWASVSHHFDYKSSKDVPRKLRRRLYRLSALFEIADAEFDSLIFDANEISDQYKQDILNKEENIDIDMDSLKAYLENSDEISYWVSYIESLGVNINPPGWISRDIQMLGMANIKTLSELNDILKEAKHWGKKYLKEFYENVFGPEMPPERIFADKNGIITMLLIGNYLEIFTNEVLNDKLGWGFPERATVPARKYNPKYAK